MSEQPVCVVVGVGPGLGGVSAVRFAEAGWRVACVARSAENVAEWAEQTGGRGYTADATDLVSVRTTLERIRTELGPVHTLIWNVGSAVFGDLDKIDIDGLDLGLDTNARGLLTAVKAVVADMRAAGTGNVLITGATASLRGKPFTTAFAAGKAAQRSLAQSFARQLWPQGIHVALVIVDGMVDLPKTRASYPEAPADAFISPDAYADTLLFLARQHRSAWTFELEVRPSIETW